jgi:hypothetical protein
VGARPAPYFKISKWFYDTSIGLLQKQSTVVHC